jgi:hypothetical protein
LSLLRMHFPSRRLWSLPLGLLCRTVEHEDFISA